MAVPRRADAVAEASRTTRTDARSSQRALPVFRRECVGSTIVYESISWKLGEWGANSVDLDGLRWLATQPEPRIWVSDQQVIGVNADTGRNDYLDGQKRKEISVFMRKNNIIPIERRETILKVAKKLSLKH